MKLSEMKSVLVKRDLRLTKSLGQNFLHDQNQLRRIIMAAELSPTDQVLEIGPGLGPLTELLLQKVGTVLALEMDQRLVDFLTQKFAGVNNLQLLRADALDYVKHHRQWRDWKLVANLPYAVASPLLVELATADEPPQRLTATLQLEVVQRLAADAGSEHYGVLSLLIGLRYQSQGWFKIPATCFFPAPEIDSACITLSLRDKPLLAPAKQGEFTQIVKRGFSQRRKMMFKLLKQDWPEESLRAAFESAGLAAQTRAEQVSLAQFVRLTDILSA